MKDNIKRLFTTGALLSMFVVLSACTEADLTIDTDENTDMESVNAESTEDLSIYPKGVQDGNVSVDYFNALMDYVVEMGTYDDKVNSIKGHSLSLSDTQKQEIIETTTDYLVFLNGIRYEITNENEEEVDVYFKQSVIRSETMAKYLIRQLEGDESYSSLIKTESTAFLNDTNVLLKIMKKYELFYE